MTIIYALIIFCLLIFVHELGHFMVAKACGVKVNEFAIGMGPAIFSRQKGETKYSVRVFPIGGYCAMEGEDEDSDEPRALNNQPAWQRACILAAGSVMNFITSVILLIIIAFWAGTASTTIDQVVEVHGDLQEFAVKAVTRGIDALGEVTVRIQADDGKVYTGRGSDTDIIVSSAKAYVNAINRMINTARANRA